jgi:hypothetical protein
VDHILRALSQDDIGSGYASEANLANRPWLLVPGLKPTLVAAPATGAVATINSTVWLLALSLSWSRLMVATSLPSR